MLQPLTATLLLYFDSVKYRQIKTASNDGSAGKSNANRFSMIIRQPVSTRGDYPTGAIHSHFHPLLTELSRKIQLNSYLSIFAYLKLLMKQ
jgi:hypothetical protein